MFFMIHPRGLLWEGAVSIELYFKKEMKTSESCFQTFSTGTDNAQS